MTTLGQEGNAETVPQVVSYRRKSGLPAAFAVGLVLVLIGVVIVVVASRKHGGAATQPPLPFGAEEQAYAANIHFQMADPAMSRASNMLGQTLTYLNAFVGNDGPRAIKQMEVTVEFHDEFNQVILRETRRIPTTLDGAPLAPGEHRSFQFTFEHIPEDWERTRQTPTLHVSGLLLK